MVTRVARPLLIEAKEMKTVSNILTCFGAALCSLAAQAQQVEQFEIEGSTFSGQHAAIIEAPFDGVAFYGNGDTAESTLELSSVPGIFHMELRGSSSNDSAAGVSIYLGDKRIGSASFTGASPTVQTIDFKLKDLPSSSVLAFVLESDSGANDTYLDWYKVYRDGDIPALPGAPTLPSEGAYYSGEYRNMFQELGRSAEEVDQRLQAAYDQLFHSSDLENEALFIPVGDDMAYIWDTGNNDVRSEGMSYGMMMALQMDRQDDFDKLWKWAQTYSLNKDGEMKGYFAWQVSVTGNVLDKNPAPDGEEYFAMALFFAANRWGDRTGIFNYSAQANKILDDMFANGVTRFANGGTKENISLFNHDELQIVFSPAKATENNFTDPSYHLPAFYDLWALWANNNNTFWAELATTSRNFWKTTAHAETGLSPDYAYFDGRPHSAETAIKEHFQYDAWRTIANAGMDYSWWAKDAWQTTWTNRLQAFFMTQGVETYGGLYRLSGEVYDNNADHSPGLVGMNAVASLAANHANTWEFVQNLWDTKTPTGKYRYYDGCLYMFGMLAMSGQYKIYCPNGVCDGQPPVSSSTSSSGSSSSSSSASSSSSGAGIVGDRYEFEDGVIEPSFRETITSPFNGAKLYGNNESVSFSIALSPDDYTFVIRGASTDSRSAGIDLYIDGVKVGETAFDSTTAQESTIQFSLAASAHDVQFILTTDSGLNDTLLDWFEIKSATASASSSSSSSTSSSSSSTSSSTSSSGGTAGKGGAIGWLSMLFLMTAGGFIRRSLQRLPRA